MQFAENFLACQESLLVLDRRQMQTAKNYGLHLNKLEALQPIKFCINKH